jgi:hypothetical protein
VLGVERVPEDAGADHRHHQRRSVDGTKARLT